MIRKSIRFLCGMLALCCLLLAFAAPAAAESPSAIRVLLRRLALSDRMDLTLSGRYLVRSASGAELLLPEEARVTVLLQDRQLFLYSGGISAGMGASCSFLAQQSGGAEPGIRFNLQAGFYPGSLSVTIEDGRLVPILSLPLETYLKGVVPYEMGDGFPPEALKAQAVCARTYALSRMQPSAAWDVVDTTNDQVFRGLNDASPKSMQAVEDTAGLVLTCDGKLITAWYSASNGGQTELPAHVWEGKAPRCFAVTEDPWDAANPESVVRTCVLARDASGVSPAFVKLIHEAALADPRLRDLIPNEDFRLSRLNALALTTPRFASPSRLMTRLEVTFETDSFRKDGKAESAGEEDELGITDLLSSYPMTVTLDLFPDTVIALGLSISGANNEIITLQEDDSAFTLTSGRYGHGVGLSQRGAQQMANAGGKDFREILSFYFPGSTLKRYTGETPSLPTPPPQLARDPGPAPTATPRPTLMPVTQELPEGARMAYVTGISQDSTLNLRAQPSAGAEVLMRLYYGQPLIVLEKSDVPGWVHVRTDAAEGFVMESFLEYAPDLPKG